MALKLKLVSDLVKIAEAGGGMRIDVGSKLTSDLIKIAEATKRGGGLLFLQGANQKLVSDLVKIAEAGGGRVVFEDN